MKKAGTSSGKRRPATSGRGSAGRRGDDVRSDLWVEVERRGSGGVEIELQSRVATYYEASIREQIVATLASVGLGHAAVAVEDKGALPFVIAARVEAAARRAGAEPGAPPDASVVPLPLTRDRRRRSRLYLPGNEPKYFVNAGLHGPDGIILDLEDSVHPDEKDAARLLVRNALLEVDFAGAERMVRINPLPVGRDDLGEIAAARPDLVLIPKVEHADQVREVGGVLDATHPRDDGGPWLMPILESALGVEHAFEIAGASRRIVALTLGLEDYAADLGVPRSTDGEESRYARMRIVNAARAAGVQAIDSVFSDVGDEEGLARWGRNSRALGFVGMGCLHPRQICPIHQAYAPRPDEIRRALRVVEASERASAAGLGVVSLGSKMIDLPVLEQARRIVEQAERDGTLPGGDGEPNPS